MIQLKTRNIEGNAVKLFERSIFCIHGFGGSATDWERLPLLSASSINSLNNFSFAKIPKHSNYRVDESMGLAKTVVDLCEQFNRIESKEIYLMGYSMGGRLALLMAGSRLLPKLSGIILISSGLGRLSDSERALRRKRDLLHAKALIEDPLSFWQSWYEEPIFCSTKSLAANDFDSLISQKLRHNSMELAKALQEFSPANHGDLTRSLPSEMPVLFLAGSDDIKYVSEGKKLVERHGLTSFVEIENASHSLLWEQPTATSEAISNWLQRAN